MSAKKDCIGKTMSERPGLNDPARERLVGLRPVSGEGEVIAGGHLFNEGAEAVRENDQGYITSVAHAPTLGHMLALGFLKNGPERVGEKVKMVDHLRGMETLCEVIHPVVFDPEGGRVRG